MGIHILAKHALQFDHPTGDFEPVTVKYQEVTVIPDWAAESSMFKAAKTAGLINVFDSVADVKEEDPEPKAKKATS